VHTSDSMSPKPGRKPQATRERHISSDGKWRSFPRVPNLLQYVSTGTYFARVKVDGKLFRESLGTDVFTTAKLKLPDFLKKKKTTKLASGTFGEARTLYEAGLENDHTLAEGTKRYRRFCLKALAASWPKLNSKPLTKITEDDCQEWAKRFSAEKDEQYFNNTLGTLRAVLERGGLIGADNPARTIKRIGVKPTILQLPEPAQFTRMLEIIETAGARQSKDCADLVRFLAFSGCRISEARKVTWADVDLARGEITVHNAKRRRTSNSTLTRRVPIIPPMRALLQRLQKDSLLPTDRVCRLGECEKSLARACQIVGIPRLTHHDLRHLFATRCLESGVDIATVSRWLGHADGGLALRIYGHLRRTHSTQMAQLVTFGGKEAP
jgi:integrase